MYYIYNIDLHYHCGLERQQGVSIDDYLNHARVTGRRIVGITDHIEKYIGCNLEDKDRLYSTGAEGLLEYYQDVKQYCNKYPSLQILFAPEISLDFDFNKIPQNLIDVCDYFICEPPIADEDRTQSILNRMNEMAKFSQDTKKPLFLAHPLRHGINQRAVKCKEVEQWVIDLKYHYDLEKYSLKQMNEFFWVDVEALANASVELDIPLEINGGTHARIINTNLMNVLRIYIAANYYMKNKGAQFVCGSDQHAFIQNNMRSGRYMPQQVFEELGIGVKDMHFLKKIVVNI